MSKSKPSAAPAAAKKPSVWVVIIVAVLVICAVAEGIILYRMHTGSTVLVTLNGEPFAEYNLNINGKHRLETEDGYNLLVIRGGQAWIEEADCATHACMQMGKISKAGELIVCLPHGFVVEIEE